jgi:hypothetical protein
MSQLRGIVKIDGIGLADLPRIGLYPTDTVALGDEAGVGDEPAACEVADGVLIVHGHSDLAGVDESIAATFGARVVAVGLSSAAGVSSLSVSEADGRRRQLVDVLEKGSQGTGEPIPEEEGHDRLTEESALAIFHRLTGISLDDIARTEFRVLRARQEHDDAEGRPLIKRLFGLH